MAVFHHLPEGGGRRVAGQMITELTRTFQVTVHYPEGSAGLDVPEHVEKRAWPFPAGRKLSVARRLAAPLTLPARLRSFDRLCRNISEEIDPSSDAVLVHNSMLVAAPPLLRYLQKPSVYFCYEYPRHLYESDLIRRVSGPARVLLAPLRRMEKRMDLLAASSAGSIVTFSSWMGRLVQGIYGRPAAIVHPGVDPGTFHPVPSRENSSFVLSVGALWPFKGHELAIASLAALPEERRPALVIVADRELPGYVNTLVALAERSGVDLGIRQRISDQELRETYSAALAVLCCQHREPYGLVPLEAMACGTSVIAVREGGFMDNVFHGRNGLLVERDPSQMASAVSRLMDDADLRRELIAGGFDFVSTERMVSTAGTSLADIITGSISSRHAD